jgi:hypothetical protein
MTGENLSISGFSRVIQVSAPDGYEKKIHKAERTRNMENGSPDFARLQRVGGERHKLINTLLEFIGKVSSSWGSAGDFHAIRRLT